MIDVKKEMENALYTDYEVATGRPSTADARQRMNALIEILERFNETVNKSNTQYTPEEWQRAYRDLRRQMKRAIKEDMNIIIRG